MNAADVFEILQRIAATNARGEKEAILARHLEDATLRRIIWFACNPMITFGLTPDKPKTTSTAEDMDFDCNSDDVWDLLDDLRYRRLTGNAAKTALADLRAKLSPASDEIIWRILSKDLRAGMTANTVNRVVPGTIPVFKVMLAHKYEEARVTEFPVAVEPKLDGLRVIGLVCDGEAKFFSRTGKHFPALDHLGPGVAQMVKQAFDDAKALSDDPIAAKFLKMLGQDKPRLAIDAEVISGTFNKTTGDVRRKEESAKDAALHMFDAVPYDFMVGESQAYGEAFSVRRTFLDFISSKAPLWSEIFTTKIFTVNSHAEIDEFYASARNDGLEGAMVKSLNGLYHKAISRAWMKIKAQETEDLPVIGAFEGEGKYAGMLGGLIVDRAGVQVRVGGGFSDMQRHSIWASWCANSDSLLGVLIEVKYHEVLDTGSLRHPRFVAFRYDKDEREAA